MKLLPGEIDHPLPRERVQAHALDGGDEFPRFPPRRDVIIPPAARHFLEIESDYPVGEIVPVAKVTQEPAVDAFVPECLLDFLEVHGGFPGEMEEDQLNTSLVTKIYQVAM